MKVLPTSYLPPISWFTALQSGEPCAIEQYENFQKQTLRNRCWIDSPNGRLALTVPVDRSTFHQGKCLTKDVRISYHLDWQHQHWYALESSYFNSAFFEYLQDDFRPLYQHHWDFLIDFNEALLAKCCELIDLQPLELRRTTEFQGLSLTYPTVQEQEPYYQVFAHKHGFQADLSVIDLLFNLGPESLVYINRMVTNTDITAARG